MRALAIALALALSGCACDHVKDGVLLLEEADALAETVDTATTRMLTPEEQAAAKAVADKLRAHARLLVVAR